MTGEITDFKHGIWKRAPFGVSTCSNHAERFHGVLNKACHTKASLSERLGIVQREIFKKFEKYASDPNAQAKKQFRQLQKNSSNKPDTCPRGCDSGGILSVRYGTPFPCPHVRVPPDATIEFPELPPMTLFDDLPIHAIEGDSRMQKWLKKLDRPRGNESRIQWTASNETLAEYPGNSSWMAFVRQVAAELRSLGERSMHWEDLVIKVTTEYLSMCHGENPENVSVEMGSEFRGGLLEQILN
jgi:hypothetical protein